MTLEGQQAFLKMFAETWALVPDMRFGQLVSWIGDMGHDTFDSPLPSQDDDEFLAMLKEHLAELKEWRANRTAAA